MSGEIVILSGRRVLLCAADGPLLSNECDLGDLMGEAYVLEAEVIVLPTAMLGSGFFDLSTRIAGEMLQKLINYRYRPVILGDISVELAGSQALRDFVRESNRGTMVWFVDDMAALEAKLAGA